MNQIIVMSQELIESEVKSYPQNQVGNLFEEAQERISPELGFIIYEVMKYRKILIL